MQACGAAYAGCAVLEERLLPGDRLAVVAEGRHAPESDASRALGIEGTDERGVRALLDLIVVVEEMQVSAPGLRRSLVAHQRRATAARNAAAPVLYPVVDDPADGFGGRSLGAVVDDLHLHRNRALGQRALGGGGGHGRATKRGNDDRDVGYCAHGGAGRDARTPEDSASAEGARSAARRRPQSFSFPEL